MTNRIIFMGTPDFAVPALQKLLNHYPVIAVVTQPDRRSGRGRKLVAQPVKQIALEANVPVLQPPTLKDPEVVQQLKDLRPSLIVVAAFGQILRSEVLTMPPWGCINIHASLLPRWRGAAPIAAAIRAGDTETGITLMQMDTGLDTGAIIRRRAISITEQHTQATLTAILADLGAELLIETLPDWFAGKIKPYPQNDAAATLARRIKKEEGSIDWEQPAQVIERLIRAYDPWPGTFTCWDEKRLKILTASVIHQNQFSTAHLQPGTILQVSKEIAVATGENLLCLGQIQLAGKRAVAAADFARGTPDFVGARLLSCP